MRSEIVPHLDILQLWSVDIAVLDIKHLKDGEKMHPHVHLPQYHGVKGLGYFEVP